MNIFEALQANGNFILVNLLIQITVLSGLALLIALRFMQNAAVRYNILFPTMLSLLLLTFVSLGMQLNGKNLLFIPLQDEATLSASEIHVQFVMDEFSFEEFVLRPASRISASLETTVAPEESFTTSTLASFWTFMRSLPLYLIALAIWSGGLLFLTIGLLRSFHHIDHISRRSRPLHAEERRYVDRLLAAHRGSGAELHFRASKQISSPMLIGLSQPVVLLPDRFLENLNESQLRSVLLHELAHHQRNDGIANFIQKVVLAIFWFHPLVYVLDRMLTRAREEICDNYVINCEQPVNYGEALLQVSSFSASHRHSAQPLHFSVGVLGNSWNLESRIRDLLSEGRDKTVQLNSRKKRLMQFFIFGLSVFLAACQVGTAQSQSPQDQALEFQEQAQRLLEERQRMEVATRELENQLRTLREQLDRRDREDRDTALSKEVMLRSLAELQSVFMVEENAVHFQDITELTKRLLREMLRQNQAQVLLHPIAAQSMQDILASLENEQLDFESLRGSIYRLDALVAAQIPSDNEETSDSNRRPPPPARRAGTLSPPVMQAITDIQDLMSPADENVEPDLVAAKLKLDELRESLFETMNPFEKSTLLNFYTNYYLSLDDYPGALNAFEEILTIDPLREDMRLRTLRSLGQLYAAEEQWRASIDNYATWRAASLEEDDVVYRGLSYAHYQLEQFPEALSHWIAYMDLQRAEGEDLGRDDYAYLNGLYFTLQDYAGALEVTKDMILLFNHPTDWNNLRALYRRLDEGAASGSDDDSVNTAQITNDPIFEPATLNGADGEYLPLVAIAPQYPTRAAQQGIEGWVLVSFTVDGVGDVIEDSISVVDADPPDVFNRSATRATEGFKFKPRMINGKGVDVPGVQYLFRWALENDDV